jgi:hypothetical protein
MADGIHAGMDAVETAEAQAVVNGLFAEAELE